MGMCNPKLWWLALVVLLWTPSAQCRNFTHEDIRDAMLSIVHMMRMSEDKLERHEYREKALGEQVKKMLNGLDKKHRALEPVKGMISRLDERLSNVETILLRYEEREKGAQKKTNEALDGIQKSLQALTLAIQPLKSSKDTEIDNNLTTNVDTLERRLETTDAKIDSVKTEIEKLKNSLSKDALRAMCLEVASNVNPYEKHMTAAEEMFNKYSITPFEKHLSETERLLNKYESKLNEFNETSNKIPTDIVQLNEVALADEAWHSKMTEEMERQGGEIKKIQQLLSDAEGMWKQLPRVSDLQLATNQTLEAIVNATETMKENSDKSVTKMTTKLRELSERLLVTNEDIQQSLTQGNTLTERTFGDISRSYEQLRTEVQTLTKSEQVMLQTADEVMATKKRIEYGVHQIVMQVSEFILKQGKRMNGTISDRLNQIESAIVENQALAQVNLSNKIETEMSQVWRQIGIMHEQIKSSKGTLEKLTERTEQYVNSSTTTMGKVKDQVGDISDRMLPLRDDFNYALGKLDLVTQEFSQISTSLSKTLTNLKKEVPALQDKNVPDPGPGPHKIASGEITS